jgi:hypothetical protein
MTSAGVELGLKAKPQGLICSIHPLRALPLCARSG